MRNMNQTDATVVAPDPLPTAPARTVALRCLAMLGVATAVIHFAVSGSHFQEYWVFGVFMLVVAWLQLVWSAAVVVRPARVLLWAGVILNLGVVAVYLVTRGVGDVVGPTPDSTEPIGFGDALCTAFEVLVAAACLWLLVVAADRRVRRRTLVTTPATVGVVTAVLLSVALVDGGPEMVMPMNGAAPAAPQPTGIHLATTSPAGDIQMPSPDMRMAPGMRMAGGMCDTTPTSQQQQAAVSLVDDSWQGARKYESLAAAKAAGYRPLTPTGKAVVHYVNPAYYRATVLGGQVLDTAAPQSLVYANTPNGAVLAAAMYIGGPHSPTPQPGGCLTQWHVHTNLCVSAQEGVVGTVGDGGTCPAGSRNRATPPMMHVWFVPIPGGPTAVDAPDSDVVRAAQQVSAPANGMA